MFPGTALRTVRDFSSADCVYSARPRLGERPRLRGTALGFVGKRKKTESFKNPPKKKPSASPGFVFFIFSAAGFTVRRTDCLAFHQTHILCNEHVWRHFVLSVFESVVSRQRNRKVKQIRLINKWVMSTTANRLEILQQKAANYFLLVVKKKSLRGLFLNSLFICSAFHLFVFTSA